MKKIFTFLIIFIIVAMCGSFVIIGNKNSNSSSSNNSNIDYSLLKMGCLGDSITYGVDGVNGGVMSEPYSTLLKNELSFNEVYNYGVNGTTYCLNNLGRRSLVDCYDTLHYDLDIISVMCGVNDYDCSLPLGTIDDINGYTVYGAIKIVAKGLKELYPNSFIFFITPLNTTWSNNTTYDLIEVVNAIKEVCSIENIPVLDLFSNGGYEIEMNNSNSDGLHPSQEFIKNYTAPQIAQFIKDNYNK